MQPFSRSWWVEPPRLLAGCYPGAPDATDTKRKLVALLDAGIDSVICLQEENERGHRGAPFRPYLGDLKSLAAARGVTIRWRRHPIADMGVPDVGSMRAILDDIDAQRRRGGVYVHCWGGHGRTGTVVGCWLVRHGHDGQAALRRIRGLRSVDPSLVHQPSPQTDAQRDLILGWHEHEAAAGGVSTRDRFRGCLLGLAVGDAVGTTLEFKAPGTFSPIDDMIGGGPFGLQPGQWTDDTSMALCLAESLVERGGFDPVDQLRRYVRWWTDGHWSSTGTCFDIGTTTARALQLFQRTGEPWCGRTDPHSAGNGSLMRLAPVPMAYATDPGRAVERAGESSRTTHGAVECVDACRFYAALLVRALSGRRKDDLLSDEPPIGAEGRPLAPRIAEIAAGTYARREPPEIRGSGYVVSALEAALWAFHRTSTYRDGLLDAVNLGDDADTTGAIYGQIAGAYYGADAIPETWRGELALHDEIVTMADRLLEMSAGRARG